MSHSLCKIIIISKTATRLPLRDYWLSLTVGLVLISLIRSLSLKMWETTAFSSVRSDTSVVFTNLYTRFVPLEIYWLMGAGPSHAPLSIIDDKLWGILGRGGREQSMEPFHPSWFHIYVTHIYVVSLWPIFFINSRTLNDLTDGSIKR